MATQKDLLRAAVLSGAVEGMSVSEEVIDLNVSATLPEHGLHVTSPITGYCAIRVISKRGKSRWRPVVFFRTSPWNREF